MAAIALPYPNELTFRPFQPWLWLDCAGLMLCDLGFVVLALLARDLRWLLPIVPISVCILLLIVRPHAHTITISGTPTASGCCPPTVTRSTSSTS